jgi:hypothetical protein
MEKRDQGSDTEKTSAHRIRIPVLSKYRNKNLETGGNWVFQ